MVEEVTTDWCGEIIRVDRDLGTVDLEDRRGSRVPSLSDPASCSTVVPVILAPPSRKAPDRPSAHRVGLGRGRQHPGPRRPRQPDLRRGPPRRRAGREGLGRRPADRGRRRRVPRGRRRPAGDVPRLRARPGAPHRRARRPPGRRHQGEHDRASRSPGPLGKHVLVVGHPYIDVWQAVKPARLGLEAWPTVPRGIAWKHGVLRRTSGWPHARPGRHRAGVEAHPRQGPHLRRPRAGLLGRVEELIDFVTT